MLNLMMLNAITGLLIMFGVGACCIYEIQGYRVVALFGLDKAAHTPGESIYPVTGRDPGSQ